MDIVNQTQRFKALPKKAAKVAAKSTTAAAKPAAGSKSENNLMADLEMTPEEEALDKKFLTIIDREDRFKAAPKKSAKAATKTET